MLRIDPWGAALAGLGAAVFALQGFDGVLSRDLALYAYAGQQFADGVPPYVAVLNRAGPLAHMVPGVGALIARGLGADDLLAMRVLMMVLSVSTVWLTYLLGRDLFASRAAGVAAAATVLSSRAVIVYAGGGPREKTTMVLLVVCALLAVVHRRWGWAGVATALATLTWQPAFWLCLAAAVVAAIRLPVANNWRHTVRAWTWFGLGGVVATSVIIAYFVVVGAFRAFLQGFIVANATSTSQVGLVRLLQAKSDEMLAAWGWSLWVLVLGLLGTLVLAWRARSATEPAGRALVGMGAATLASVGWSLYVFNGWADAMFVIPLAAVGVGGTVAWLADNWSAKGAVGLAAAYVVLTVSFAGLTAWRTSDDVVGPMRSETLAALDLAGPRASVQSIGGPQPLVLAGLKNPIRYQMFLTGLEDYVDEIEPGGLARIAADLRQRQPTFVTVDRTDRYDWIEPVLRSDYRQVGQTAGFFWYANKDLGNERLSELEQILTPPP